MAEPSKTAGSSLLSLLAGIPSEPPTPKEPENPLLKSLVLLSKAPAHPLDKAEGAHGLWVPPQPQLYNPFYEQGVDSFSGSVGVSASPPRGTLSGPRAQPPARALTLSETLEAVGGAVRSIPGTIDSVGKALRTIGGTIVRGLDWLDRHLPRGPLDPYGRPVARWNVQLYLLARRAYQGDWVARATFLNEIEADDDPENVVRVEDLLGPTFGPQRTDLRAHWEQETPEEARRQLRELLEGHKRRSSLEDKERRKGERVYEHLRQFGRDEDLADAERKEDERILYERLRDALPERQFMFCWYRGQGMSYEEIAAEMGIGISSVKTHARRVKSNPNLRGLLGQ
jgi:DNA-directed RNA polymerase specialized sigma24 family protein